jgi:uncharacterized membrane protein
MLEAAFRLTEFLGLGVWVGSILFFSFVVAPTAFRALDPQNAGLFIRGVFPRYYLFGIICGAITLAAGVAVRAVRQEWAGRSAVTLAIVGAMFLTTVYARQGLMPIIERRRDARAAAEEGTEAYEAAHRAFRAGHRVSVILNLGVLLLGVVAFLLLPAIRRSV